jgi:hypothetical protein
MNLELRNSTDFKISELVIVTKAGSIDITSIYEEINIYDSIFSPVMTGKILISDSIGLSDKLIFDGSETILINILKDENSDIANFKKSFRIYKQSDRVSDGYNNEKYVLNFCSDELIYSDQQRLNKSYDSTYSDIIKKIMTDYLKISNNQLGGRYEDSYGIRKVVIPNLKPIEAIQWCCKRALDINSSPDFVFFQNITGYNFVSLSKLLSEKDILDVNYQIKNSNDTDSIGDMSGARSVEVISQNDAISKTRSGVDAGKFIGFDPITRSIETKNISFGDHYDSMKHGNKNPNVSIIKNRDGIDNTQMFNSKKTMSVFSALQSKSNYIKEKSPETISKVDDTENYLFQRKAIFSNLVNKRIKVVMPGNFQLSSGFNINYNAPILGQKFKGEENEDDTTSGKYLIIATRHIIGYEKHETIFEAASTSNNNDFVPVSSDEQNRSIVDY